MKNPQIMCVSCKERRSKKELIRIATCDGQPVVDTNKANNSRGLYVCYDKKCVELLKKSKAIERFLKINSNDEFFDKLKLLIEEKDFD